MSVRKTLENMRIALDNAYDSISRKGGIVPRDKTMINLTEAINSIMIDPLSIPFTIYARDTGYISITKNGDPGIIYYSKNRGDLIELDGDVGIPVDIGDKVSLFRTISNDLSTSDYFTINCTNNCYVHGNVMSLINKDDYTNLYMIEYRYAFSNLFYQNSHININESVGELILPATTLANYCYYNMFYRCTSLTTAPRLPATTLAEFCYCYMFAGCSSLTTAPRLPATTLANDCYFGMFAGCSSLTTAPELSAMTLAYECYFFMFSECTSLTTAPELPAMTLAASCYNYMFNECTSLTTAPRLPATTLANDCYSRMFEDCTSITTSPELPATTLTEGCYSNMFRGCSNLNEITCLATDISADDCTIYWVNGVSSTGTFIKDSSMTSWTTGIDGIPSGWIVVNK